MNANHNITYPEYNTSQLKNPKDNYKGKWIPRELEDLGLSAIEQMLLATIDSLDDPEDHCFASNAYLAQRMGLSQSRISFYITKFKRMNLLKELPYNGRNRVLQSLKYNWYKQVSKKELCVKTRSLTTRKRASYIKKDTSPSPPPPSSKVPKEKPKPKPNPKPIPKNPLRGEEEDSSIEEKKKALSQIELTEKNKTRVAKKYTLQEILIAIEIFLTQEVKSNPMGLLLSILNNPQNWEKKVVKKNKDELDKEKEAYRAKNKILAESYINMFKWVNYRIDTNFVKFKTTNSNGEFLTLFYDDPSFESLLSKYIALIPY